MPGCEPPAFLARLPPSKGTSAPVMDDDASEASRIALYPFRRVFFVAVRD